MRLRPSRNRQPAAKGGAGKRVYLHVGAPKTGSTFLQHVLWHNRHVLANAGVSYPLEDVREHFAATMDLRQMTWGGGRDPAWDGAWERIAARAREWHGQTVVISNELLGGANPAQILRAVESLAPAEVHVAFTARDLARQLPSDWQEQVKHTHAITFDEFVDDLVTNGMNAREPFGPMFWGLHDPVYVLGPWANAVGKEQVHVVTVPQRGAPRDTLWRRFATVLGVDPDVCDIGAVRSNPSLGAVEAELLRRINERADRVQPHIYREALRGELIDQVLQNRRDAARIALPERHRSWLHTRSEAMVGDLRRAGYDIVGDLAELAPAADAPDGVDPASIANDEVLDAALDALAALLLERHRGADR